MLIISLQRGSGTRAFIDEMRTAQDHQAKRKIACTNNEVSREDDLHWPLKYFLVFSLFRYVSIMYNGSYN